MGKTIAIVLDAIGTSVLASYAAFWQLQNAIHIAWLPMPLTIHTGTSIFMQGVGEGEEKGR